MRLAQGILCWSAGASSCDVTGPMPTCRDLTDHAFIAVFTCTSHARSGVGHRPEPILLMVPGVAD